MTISNRLIGRTWRFGDNVSTDAIAPGRLMYLRSNAEEYAKHVLEDLNPTFAKAIRKGDFIVAGENFGCGSSREIAPLIIKIRGVGGVLAKSFGRIFFRNAINNGLLLITCDTDAIRGDEELLIDLEKGEIMKIKDPEFRIYFQLGQIEKKITAEGGLLPYIEKHGSLDF